MKKILFSLLLLTFVLSTTNSQTKEDSIQLVQTGLDYLEGWYTADTARMNRALHPELIKRRVIAEQGNILVELTKPMMIEKTALHKIVPVKDQNIKIIILDIYGINASIRAETNGFVDYLHMVKTDGHWSIINALWDKRN
jgi:hypothetical protein